MSKPEFIDVDQHDLNSLLTRVSGSSLESSDKTLLLNIVQCYVWLQVTLREAKMSIARLRRVFGVGKTEKRKKDNTAEPSEQKESYESDNGDEDNQAPSSQSESQ